MSLKSKTNSGALLIHGLMKNFVAFVSDFIELGQRRFLSRFYKRYVSKLWVQNRFFNVKGMIIQSVFSLELKKVFIDLNIASHKGKANQDRLLEPAAERSFSIWEFLESRDPNHRILAIIGKPGSGKTTMLQHVTLLIATGEAPGRSKTLIPFHLPLRKFVSEIASTSTDIPDLAALLDKHWKQESPPPKWFFRKLNIYGHRCVILLDGLDEVAEQVQRKQVVVWVEQQTSKYSKAHFVITSRPHGYYSNPIANAAILQIEDFAQDQIVDFVHKWYQSTEIVAAGKSDKGVISRSEESARDLLQRIFQSETLSKLAVNPLLLTMITMVHRYIGKLPEMRAALYEDIIRVLLGRREQTVIKGIKLSYFQKRAILQALAFAMMEQQQKRDIATNDAINVIRGALQFVNLRAEDGQLFLETMMNESGLLVEADVENISFAHLTYQEFLAAAEIKNRGKEAFLIQKLGNTWWHETTLLYAATSDATEIVKACLDKEGRELDDLKLAYEISQEAMQIAPEAREELEKIVVLEAESQGPEKQQLAAELIFEIRLKRLVRLTSIVSVDRFFISQLEYQNFVHETNRRPDHWPGWLYLSREGLLPIVGVRRDDAEAFAQWLTSRARKLGHRNSQFRLPTTEEAESVKTDQEVQDQNFKHLASLELGAWAMPKNTLVFFDNEKSMVTSYLLRMRASGESETRRLGDYHAFLDDLLVKLDQQIEILRRELQATLKQLDDAISPSMPTALSDEVDRYLEKLTAIKDVLRDVASRAQERSFILTLDSSLIDDLPVELVELSRLRSGRAGAEEYQNSDIGRIHQLLTKARNRLEGLRGTLYDPADRAKRYQQDLLNYLSTELQSFAGQPIDLGQQLAFLSKLGDIRLSTNEIQAVLRREIGKNYTKAKAELLALAEYALYQNKTELLREILRGFWAVFFVEQRANRKDPLPAWEGIRLVREVRRPDEETTIT